MFTPSSSKPFKVCSFLGCHARARFAVVDWTSRENLPRYACCVPSHLVSFLTGVQTFRVIPILSDYEDYEYQARQPDRINGPEVSYRFPLPDGSATLTVHGKLKLSTKDLQVIQEHLAGLASPGMDQAQPKVITVNKERGPSEALSRICPNCQNSNFYSNQKCWRCQHDFENDFQNTIQVRAANPRTGVSWQPALTNVIYDTLFGALNWMEKFPPTIPKRKIVVKPQITPDDDLTPEEAFLMSQIYGEC
jgi:hypothetical protein